MFQTCATRGINIKVITTSEIKVSVLVDPQSTWNWPSGSADAFGLDAPPDQASRERGGHAEPLPRATPRCSRALPQRAVLPRYLVQVPIATDFRRRSRWPRRSSYHVSPPPQAGAGLLPRLASAAAFVGRPWRFASGAGPGRRNRRLRRRDGALAKARAGAPRIVHMSTSTCSTMIANAQARPRRDNRAIGGHPPLPFAAAPHRAIHIPGKGAGRARLRADESDGTGQPNRTPPSCYSPRLPIKGIRGPMLRRAGAGGPPLIAFTYPDSGFDGQRGTAQFTCCAILTRWSCAPTEVWRRGVHVSRIERSARAS